jgi:branched-chain amino acid transport system ATP-binding protein
MLRVDQVSLSFGGIDALREVSFEVGPAARFGVIGPNGAGKTALLNCISGVYRPDAGDISLDGRSLSGASMEQVSSRGLARTFQSMDHFEEFRVCDYVLLGRIDHLRRSSFLEAVRWPGYVRAERAERAKVREILEQCGLED